MKPKLFTSDQVKELMNAISSEKLQTQVSKFKTEYEKDPERFGAFKIIITTQDEDRMGDKVAEDGWDMEHYLKNPVVLWGHDYHQMPVGITLTLEKTEQGWVAEGFFAPEDANPKAQQLRRLYDLGLLNAASVGFIPKRFDEKDRSLILEQELLEWSFVSVPANAHALNLLKSKDLDAEELMTKGFLTKEEDGAESGEPAAPQGGDGQKNDADQGEGAEGGDSGAEGQGEGGEGNEGGEKGFSQKNIDQAKKNIGNVLSKLNTEVGNLITRAFETITSELSAVQSNEQDSNKALNEFKVKLAIERLEKLLTEGSDIKSVLDEALSAEVQNATTTTCKAEESGEKEMAKLVKLLNSVTSKALEKYKSKN